MRKDKSRGLLATVGHFLTCSSHAAADGEISVDLHRELDPGTLRDFEDSIIDNTGLVNLTGSKLRKYEARLRELEKILLRTAYIPLDYPAAADEIPHQAKSLPPEEADRLLPSAQWRIETGKEADTPREVLRIGRQRDGTSRKVKRRSSLGDLKFVPAVSFEEKIGGLNRLATTKSTWSCPRPGELTRTRSLGDIGSLERQDIAGGLNRLESISVALPRGERGVIPKDTAGGLNRLETIFSRWSRPQGLRRSRSLVNVRQVAAVKPQTAEDRLNRLETTLSPWSQPQGLQRSRSLDDVRGAPKVSPQASEDRLNRLKTTLWTWWWPSQHTTNRSLYDAREAPTVRPQASEDRMNLLKTSLSTWSPPRRLTRSLSFGDMREAPTVSPQPIGDRLNRLETSYSPWSTPRIERKQSGDGASPRAIPSVTPQHMADMLNRLETSVWLWRSRTPKTGSERVTRTRKLLKLKSPAPLRYRHSDGTSRRQPSPFWVSSSDFDSEAAQTLSGETFSTSLGEKNHRQRRHLWSLEGIVECSPAELGKILAEQSIGSETESGLDDFASQSTSDWSHSRVSQTERARSTLLSARQVYITSEKGGACWDEDGVTRLVSQEPSSKFIIKEKKSPV